MLAVVRLRLRLLAVVLRAAEAVLRNRHPAVVQAVAEIMRSPRRSRPHHRSVVAVQAAEPLRATTRSTTRWVRTITVRLRLLRRKGHRLRQSKLFLATTRLVPASRSKRSTGCLGNCDRVMATSFVATPNSASNVCKPRHTGQLTGVFSFCADRSAVIFVSRIRSFFSLLFPRRACEREEQITGHLP